MATSDLNKITDNELLNLYFKTDKMEYLGILFKRYTKTLIGVAYKYIEDLHDAEDIVQMIFIKFIETIRPDIQNIGGWLYMLTKNESLNFVKKQSRSHHIRHMSDDTQIIDESDHSMTIILKNEENLKHLSDALLSLKPEQRLAIECFYLKNMSYEEISQNHSWTINEVKSYIQNGKRNLKIKLENTIQK